jgi:hypothetical protein
MGELEYRVDASADLQNWTLPLSQTTNPPGLGSPPAGYEWVTFKAETPSPGKAFGRVKVGETVPD